MERVRKPKQIQVEQITIAVADLIFLRRNPQYLTPHQMEALKASITRDGFLAPILVRRKGKKYEILSGNHRAMAANELGFKTVPALCGRFTEQQAKRIAINLNTVHGDPTAELLVPFLAELDEELLSTIHLDESMRSEIAALDANMAELFARMEPPDAWNIESVQSNIGKCVCPLCGKHHICGNTRQTDGVQAGKDNPR
jgi:ParB-like chromosome segregation protein Spo0J